MIWNLGACDMRCLMDNVYQQKERGGPDLTAVAARGGYDRVKQRSAARLGSLGICISCSLRLTADWALTMRLSRCCTANWMP